MKYSINYSVIYNKHYTNYELWVGYPYDQVFGTANKEDRYIFKNLSYTRAVLIAAKIVSRKRSFYFRIENGI